MPLHYEALRREVRDLFYSDLPEDLLAQKTSSGDILILNRIGWGKTYLKQAGMVEYPVRSMVRITEKGKKALEKGKLTLKDIQQDKDFLAYRQLKESQKKGEVLEQVESASPQDLLDQGFAQIELQLKSELLEKLRGVDPFYFQKVVLQLLQKMGYGDFVETKKTGDGGIDGIINQDQLGLEKIYMQAKRYAEGNLVREKDIRNFIGAMSGDTHKGFFVTTSEFDAGAVRKAEDAIHKIILIDGSKLVNLMLKFDVGVQTVQSYEVKKVDEEFFEG